MEKDVFCKIVAGEIPCYKLYEDDDVLAFLDICHILAIFMNNRVTNTQRSAKNIGSCIRHDTS